MATTQVLSKQDTLMHFWGRGALAFKLKMVMREIIRQGYGRQIVIGNLQIDIENEEYTIIHESHFDGVN